MAAAGLAQGGGHGLRYRPFIERPAAAGSYRRERFCECGLAMQVAFAGNPVVRQEDRPRRLVSPQEVGSPQPVEADAGVDGIAAARVSDGGCEQPAEVHVAVGLVQAGPGIDGAGHGYGVNGGRLDLADAMFEEGIQGRRPRRPPGAVEADHVISAAKAQKRKAVAADARRLRLHHGQCRRGGDGGVERIAALAQDIDGNAGRKRVGGGRHAVAGMHGRSTWEVEVAQSFSCPIILRGALAAEAA